MKKKLFTLLTLLLCLCSGAWADKEETLTATSTAGSSISKGGTYTTVTLPSGKTFSSNSIKLTTSDCYDFTISVNETSNYYLKEIVFGNGNTSWTSLTDNGTSSTITKSNPGSTTDRFVWSSTATTNTSVTFTPTVSAQVNINYIKITLGEISGGKTTLAGSWSAASPSFKVGDDASGSIPTFGVTTTGASSSDYTITYSQPTGTLATVNSSSGITAISTTAAGTSTVRATLGLTTAGEAKYTLPSPAYYDCVITVTAGSNDASVKKVEVVANGKYSASKSGTAYTATIGGTTSATVTITPNHEGAIVTSGATTGSAGAAINVNATAGTQLAFSITAEDGSTVANYTLDITKADDLTATNDEYYLAKNEQVYGGQKIIGDHITMMFDTNTNGTFSKCSQNDYVKDYNPKYVAHFNGTGVSGCWYKFTPTKDGKLTVGIILNNDKNMYFDSPSVGTHTTLSGTYWGNQGENNTVSGTFSGTSFNVSSKIQGGLITLNVEKDKDYYLYASGTKLGFLGFQFIPSTTEVTVSNLGITGEKDYATMYYSDRAFAVPTGVKAHTYKLNGDALTISRTYENGGTYPVIPAGEAVVLEADVESNTQYTFTVSSTETTADANNLLKGTDVATAINAAGYKYYKLSLNNAGNAVGFFFDAANGASINNGAHKAYLRIATGSGEARSFYLFNNETTGINAIDNGQLTMDYDAPMYNLAGQRVNKSYKGVVIVNGKKMLNK